MKPVVEIIVSPSGDIQIDAIGFKGIDCEKATRYLEEALGVCSEKQRKPEYHQAQGKTVQQRLGS